MKDTALPAAPANDRIEAWYTETIEATRPPAVRSLLEARGIDRFDLLRVARMDAGSLDATGRTTLSATELATRVGSDALRIRRCRRLLVELRRYAFESVLPSDGEARFELRRSVAHRPEPHAAA